MERMGRAQPLQGRCTPRCHWRDAPGASARWNVIAQQTLMAEADRGPQDRHIFWADGWDGYPMARQRLIDSMATSPVKDTLVLGGDVHSFWASDLRRDFTGPGPIVATEFVGGSITSQGPSADRVKAMLAKNPHLRYGRSGVYGYGLAALSKPLFPLAGSTATVLLAFARDATQAFMICPGVPAPWVP